MFHEAMSTFLQRGSGGLDVTFRLCSEAPALNAERAMSMAGIVNDNRSCFLIICKTLLISGMTWCTVQLSPKLRHTARKDRFSYACSSPSGPAAYSRLPRHSDTPDEILCSISSSAALSSAGMNLSPVMFS